MRDAMNDYKLEHIFSYVGRLADPEIIGPVPEGIRVNFYSAGARLRDLAFEARCVLWAVTG